MRHWLIALPLLAACAMPDRGGTRIIGHGGLGTDGEYPMNSRESLLGALALGIDGIELDAQLTADGVLVAYHPADLTELTACSGKVNALPWAELKRCALGSGSAPFPIARVDSLLLEAARLHPFADFTLDCKLFAAGDWWAYLHAFSDAVLALEQQPTLHGRILVDCQTEDFLRLLAQKRSGFPAFLYATAMEGAIEKARALGCAGITIDQDRATADDVRAAHAAGLQVAFFGTRDAWSHRSALGKRPDRLQTDAPERFAR